MYDDHGADGEDPEDTNMYLNSMDIDDDINSLMNCHQLEGVMPADECTSIVPSSLSATTLPKEEFLDDEDDDKEMNEQQQDEDELEDEKPNIDATTDYSDSAVVPGITTVHGIVLKNNMNSSATQNVKDGIRLTNADDEDVDNPSSMDMRLYMNGTVSTISKDGTVSAISGGGNGVVGISAGAGTGAAAAADDEPDETMCQICATVFKTRYNLLRHFQKRHPEFKMYECDLCRISFPSIEEFKDHLEEKHSKVQSTHTVDSKQVRFACDVCGNMYKNKASAMNHLLTHTAKKTVYCSQCDFSCYTKQQLGVHQTKHDKRFVCDICNKRFAQKSQLDVHVNAVHYNQRPYVCILCKKSFKTKGSHDAHMIVHTDTRNYQCPHCDKKCRKRYDLTLHIRTHTGEKPFKCSVCGRGFVQMCDTRKHEMLHFKPGKRKNVPFSSEVTTVDDE